MRALFCDLDGAPLEPVMQSKPPPHIAVESSPGKFHTYWIVSDVKLEQFEDLQEGLAKRFSGDPSVHDQSRVMRLPGFVHRKAEPSMVRILSTHEAPPYRAADFKPHGVDPFKQVNKEWWKYDDLPKSLTRKLNDAAIAKYSAWVPELFPSATPSKNNGYRVTSANLGRDLEEDLSFAPDGIKDFGVHDLDDPLEGKRTPVQIVMEWGFEVPVEEIAARTNTTEFEKARAWLCERLGIEPEEVTSAPKQKPDATPLKARLMQTSAEFVAGFVPPDYLIDGLLQRRYVYSMTAPTGSGKTAIALRIAAHVALGLPLAGREVEKGRVLFFAGENPDDVRTRWIKLCEEMEQDPDTLDVVFMPFTVDLSAKKIRERINAEAAEHGPFSLLIVDTSAALLHRRR